MRCKPVKEQFHIIYKIPDLTNTSLKKKNLGIELKKIEFVIKDDNLPQKDNKIVDVVEDNKDSSKSVFALTYVSRSIENSLTFKLFTLFLYEDA